MKEFNVSEVQLEAIYAGVRLGGGLAWEKNAKLKTNGEKRIIKTYPTDPKVQWKDWKLKPNVFE